MYLNAVNTIFISQYIYFYPSGNPFKTNTTGANGQQFAVAVHKTMTLDADNFTISNIEELSDLTKSCV